MSAQIICGNALALPLADESVDLVVTSPPYFGLRSYQDGGEHYAGQIGSEATPDEFVDALIAATREMVRVLKPSGSIWVNLGDKYSGAQAQNFSGISNRSVDSADFWRRTDPKRTGVPNKSLMGMPWRYALRCIDDLGLILRAEVIWAKPNGLPESVTDRVRRSHEQWFHFTREPRYFSAVDEVREMYDGERALSRRVKRTGFGKGDVQQSGGAWTEENALGKIPGSVWEIPTQPLTVPAHLGVDHFAAFPMEWPRRTIKGWSPSGICTACGEGRRTVRSTSMAGDNNPTSRERRNGLGINGADFYRARAANPITITGEACACPEPTAPTIPAVVLDPFGGTGTTALVADVLGRHGISVDMSRDYCRLAEWRTTDPGERARAMQVEKPPAVLAGQMDLFEEAR